MGGTQSLKSLHHVAPVWRPISAQETGSSYHLGTVGESVVLRANCPCSKSDSTLWCQEAAHMRFVHMDTEKQQKTDTEEQKLQGAAVCTDTDMRNNTGHDAPSRTT